MKPIGFFVTETCDDYEQALTLITGHGLPKEGILAWPDIRPRALFPTRKAAQAAIDRTEHYRLAFADKDLPEKKFCKVVPVVGVPEVPTP